MRVRPKAGRDALAGEHDGALAVRVASPPEGGAANDALVAFLARKLGLARSQVRILKGHASRDKLLLVDGITEDALRARLARVEARHDRPT